MCLLGPEAHGSTPEASCCHGASCAGHWDDSFAVSEAVTWWLDGAVE